ncbi:MAG: UDP-N-acetylmuramate dehydrogenase [Candidatus Paceibacterota bacterium]
MLNIQEDVFLKDLTTLRVGGPAKYFVCVKNPEELRQALSFAKSRKLPIFVLGGGSNLLISDHGFTGLIIKNEIKGIKFTDQVDDTVHVEVGAGESWDDLVTLSTARKLFGLENLSAIPGTVGGAVVQNAGAYGAELKDSVLSVTGLITNTGKDFTFKNSDCQYSYRNSIFKKNKKYIIISIVLVLKKKGVANINYADLKGKFAEAKDLTPTQIREAVVAIRQQKLPDWHKVGTAGSFFMNLIMPEKKFLDLKNKYPDLPGFKNDKGDVKVSLAWVLDKICHLKGYREGNVGLYEHQALVLINFGGATEKEISDFAKIISAKVKEKINLEIKWEVEIVR